MTFDELCERMDELGVSGDTQLVVHEPEVGFYDIDSLDVTRSGELRLIVQPNIFTE